MTVSHRSLARGAAAAVALATTVGLAGLPGTAHAATHASGRSTTHAAASHGRAVHHRKILAHKMHGRAALRALGSRTASVAAQNHLSTGALSTILSSDKTAYVAQDGQMFYQDTLADAQAEGAITGTPSASATVNSLLYPSSQTFALHSRSGSSKVIYLDFNGADVSNTAWNASGLAAGTYTGFSLDSDPTTFTDTEDAFIQQVWRQVSEIYSAFDVDVTTQDPGLAGLTRSSSSDTTYGAHVVITSAPTPRQVLCGGCLGLGYVGTYDQVDPGAYYQPSWVFDYDTSFDPMIIAQAAAHETGHNLGLHHDGTATSAYYPGTTQWGPLMGSSMNRAITQFSKGEYAGANNQEDDLSVIQQNGLSPRPASAGSTPATATALGAQPAYSTTGVIGVGGEQDVYSVDLTGCTTTLAAAVAGIGAGTTLDAGLDVLDSSGNVVASSAPASGYSMVNGIPVSTGMNASVTIPNASGMYYLRVRGTGNGDPTSLGTGWSSYGSMGQYSLAASGCGGTGSVATPTDPTSTSGGGSVITGGSGSTGGSTGGSTPATRPTPPGIGVPTPGRRGGRKTVIVRWAAPWSNGGSAITLYRIKAIRYGAGNRVTGTFTTGSVTPSAGSAEVGLPRGRYSFQVIAYNAVGASDWSMSSPVVAAR